ncbi:hypothetical protein [Streptomyces lydicus]|uniref:Uncharacterized protein n=1 Tax=Streptomyces lydicus TaxID=47763 RepID=A0A1D7VQM4_9ACTN|nr:hypothetical protein [Streptomyces lydicus]AOP49066.1 hypothetical protein SL103_24970 [Streptomyces lydicus]
MLRAPLGQRTTHEIGFIVDGGRLTRRQIGSIVLDPNEHTEVDDKSPDVRKKEMSTHSLTRLQAATRARHIRSICHLEQTALP